MGLLFHVQFKTMSLFALDFVRLDKWPYFNLFGKHVTMTKPFIIKTKIKTDKFFLKAFDEEGVLKVYWLNTNNNHKLEGKIQGTMKNIKYT